MSSNDKSGARAVSTAMEDPRQIRDGLEWPSGPGAARQNAAWAHGDELRRWSPGGDCSQEPEEGDRAVSEGEVVIPVPQEWAARAKMDAAAYEAACQRVEADPEGYWRELAERLDWMTFPTKIKDVSFNREDF